MGLRGLMVGGFGKESCVKMMKVFVLRLVFVVGLSFFLV